MILYFDITEVRAIEQHDEKGELIEVTYLNGTTKVFKGKEALFVMATIKDFYQSVILN